MMRIHSKEEILNRKVNANVKKEFRVKSISKHYKDTDKTGENILKIHTEGKKTKRGTANDKYGWIKIKISTHASHLTQEDVSRVMMLSVQIFGAIRCCAINLPNITILHYVLLF